MTFQQAILNFEKLIKENDSEKITSFYNQDPKQFINLVGHLCSKRDNIKLIKYFESLNLELNDNGHTILWNCLRAFKIKTSTHLINHMEYDTKQAILCNNIFISQFLNGEDKALRVIPLVFKKISPEKFQETLSICNKPFYQKERIAELQSIYLELTLNSRNNITNKNKKIKI